MARRTHGFQHRDCYTHITAAVYFRQSQMLWWIADRLGLTLTSEQVQHAFDALVRRGVLRLKTKGVWELETSDPEVLQSILSLDARRLQHEGLDAHDSR
jgi:hypothetical protein